MILPTFNSLHCSDLEALDSNYYLKLSDMNSR